MKKKKTEGKRDDYHVLRWHFYSISQTMMYKMNKKVGKHTSLLTLLRKMRKERHNKKIFFYLARGEMH